MTSEIARRRQQDRRRTQDLSRHTIDPSFSKNSPASLFASHLATPLVNCGILPDPFLAISFFTYCVLRPCHPASITDTTGEDSWIRLCPTSAKKHATIIILQSPTISHHSSFAFASTMNTSITTRAYRVSYILPPLMYLELPLCYRANHHVLSSQCFFLCYLVL